MYNEHVKRRFIADHTASIVSAKTLEWVFRAVEDAERRLGRDLCTMTSQEIREAVGEVGRQSYSSMRNMQSYLRGYGKWCLEHNIPDAHEDLAKFSMADMSDFARIMVAGPHDLQRQLDAVLLPETDLTFDNVIRAYLWLVFAGMPRELADTLTADNIDFTNGVVAVGNLEFVIYPQAVASLRNCISRSSFRVIHPLYEPVFKDRYPGSHLLRMIKGDADGPSIEKEYSRKRSSMHDPSLRRFNYTTLRKSGFFYRYYMLEREGAADPFRDAALMFLDDTDRKSTETVSRAVRALRRDYNYWKEAFRV